VTLPPDGEVDEKGMVNQERRAEDNSKIRQSLTVIAFTAPQRPEKVSKTPKK
jgi:hypothetical protein